LLKIRGLKVGKKLTEGFFSHPQFEDEMTAAAVETFLTHADPAQNFDIDEELTKVGQLMTALRNLSEIELDLALNGTNDLLVMQKEAAITEIELARGEVLSPEVCDTIPLNCNVDTFLEILVGNLRNAIIGLQFSKKRILNAKKNRLIVRINGLRADYLANSNAIFELEGELSNIVNSEIKNRVLSMKIFEGLNHEKATPSFLKLNEKLMWVN